MTTTLIPPNKALEGAADDWPDEVAEIMVLLGEWLATPITVERAIRYDRLVDSMYEWLEASRGTQVAPVLRTMIRRAEGAHDELLRSAEAIPSLF